MRHPPHAGGCNPVRAFGRPPALRFSFPSLFTAWRGRGHSVRPASIFTALMFLRVREDIGGGCALVRCARSCGCQVACALRCAALRAPSLLLAAVWCVAGVHATPNSGRGCNFFLRFPRMRGLFGTTAPELTTGDATAVVVWQSSTTAHSRTCRSVRERGVSAARCTPAKDAAWSRHPVRTSTRSTRPRGGLAAQCMPGTPGSVHEPGA